MKKSLQCGLVFITLISLAGCDVFVSKPDHVAELDLADAVYLGIDQSVNTSDDGANNLIKISNEQDFSEFESVQFLDDEGEFLGEDVIHADAWTIHTASEEYTIIAGEFIFKEKGGEVRHFGLLVNTLTGEIYGLEEYYFPEQKYGLTGKYYYQTDAEGNIYFVNPTDANMYRILVGDGTNIQLEKYIDGAAGISGDRNLVDQDGNVYYKYGTRVKKSSGGIEETGMRMVVVKGADGNCYGFGQEWTDNLATYALEVTEGQFRATKVTDAGFWFEQGIDVSYQFFDNDNHRSIFMCQGYVVPEKSFGDEMVIGIIFDEQDYSITPILYNNTEYMEVLGPEGDYLWTKRSNTRYEALDISSVQKDAAGNTAHISGSVTVDIPEELGEVSVMIDHSGFGLNLTGFSLADETRIAGKITVEDGLQYYKEEMVPFITTLSRVSGKD